MVEYLRKHALKTSDPADGREEGVRVVVKGERVRMRWVGVVGEEERRGEGGELNERVDVVGHLSDLAAAVGGRRGDAVVFL